MAKPAPKVGTVEDGYRFMGGNPADPSNWKVAPPSTGTVEDGFRFLGGNPADPNRWSEVSNEAGFWSTFIEGAQSLGLADEATAFANNPTEKTRRDLIKAGESERRKVDFGEGADWVAFKQLLGGSLGEALAPLAAGVGASFISTPLGGLAAASGVSGVQYTSQNLLRQAQEQEKALSEGRTPEETSLGKAALAATGQTALDVAGARVFSGVAKLFPFARPLLGGASRETTEATGAVLADAFEKGTISFSKGVAKGVGAGVAFEIPQEMAQTGLERWQAGLSLTDEEAQGEYTQAAIGAALLGGTLGGVSGALGSRTKPPAASEDALTEELLTPEGTPREGVDTLASELLKTPEDQAEYDTLVSRLSVASGIPEEEAKRLALQPFIERRQAQNQADEDDTVLQEAAEPADTEPLTTQPVAGRSTAGERVVEPTLAPITSAQVKATVPAIEQAFEASAFDFEESYGVKQLNAEQKKQAARIIIQSPEVDPYDAITSVIERGQRIRGEKIGPIIPPIEQVSPEAKITEQLVPEAAPVESNLPDLNAQIDEYTSFVSKGAQAPAPLVESIARQYVDAMKTTGVEGLVSPDRMPAFSQFIGNELDTLTPLFEAQTAPEAAPTTAETAPVVEEATPVEEDATVVEEDTSDVEPKVTVLPAGTARGAKPVNRGSQGSKQGAPVRGAAQLTAGMQAQQAFSVELQGARDNREITDAEVRELTDYMRAPQTRLQLRNVPEAIRPQWREVLALQERVDVAQQVVNNTPKTVLGQQNPTYVSAQQALADTQGQLDAAQTSIVNNARAKLDSLRTERTERRKAIEQDFRDGEISDRQRRILIGQETISRAQEDKRVTSDPDPEEAAAVTSAIENRTFNDALDMMIEIAPNKAYAAIAEGVKRAIQKIQANGWQTDIRVVHVGDRIPAGMASARGYTAGNYKDRTIKILLNGSDVTGKVGVSYETALHEFVHAATTVLLHASNRKKFEGTQATTAMLDLREVFNKVIQHFNSRVRSGYELSSLEQAIYKNRTNILDNPQELLAWGMTNPEFMRYLDEIPYTPKKSLFNRIVEIVRNVLGLAKNNDSALAEILRIGDTLFETPQQEINDILDSRSAEIGTLQNAQISAPGQKQMDKGLKKAQLANEASGMLEGLDEASAGAKLTAKEKFDAWIEGIGARKTPVITQFQPTSWIREGIARLRPPIGSILGNINLLEQNARGMRTSMREAFTRRIRRFEDFVNKHGQAEISAMMTIARVNRVDVTSYKDRADALQNDPVLQFQKARNNARGTRKRELEINTAWDAWDALGKQEGGHELYKEVRQFYKDMYTALRAAQDEDIRKLGLDEETTKNLIRQARGDVDTSAETDSDDVHPGVPQNLFPQEYFPFRRQGNYALIVKKGKGRERERYHFDGPVERNLFQARRAKQLGLVRGTDAYKDAFERLDGLENMRENMGDESFMLSQMFKVIDGIKTTEGEATGSNAAMRKTLKDKLYQTYLLTLPERSLKKQFIHADLVTGQSADVLNVFRTSAAQYAAQLPKVVYGGDIQKQIEAAYDSVKGGDPAEAARLVTLLNAFVGRVRDSMDSAEYSAWEHRVNEFTFLSLMTSIASAAVQPITLPLQVMPRMFARYGFADTFKAVGGYMPLFSVVDAARDIDPVTGERVLVMPTIGNTPFVKNNPMRAKLWRELHIKRDLFTQKQADMMLRDRPTRGTTRNTTGQKALGAYESVVNASGALLGTADQITREISGMSFAELEYKKQKKAGKTDEQALAAAVNAAVQNTDETVGNYTELEKLGIFRGGPLRRMFGFLRTYSAQRTFYYFRMLRALTKGDPTQTKIEAFKELSMVLTFTSAAAGISANFGYGFICSLIDTLMPMFFSDDEMEEWRRQDPLGADSADYRFRYQWLPENFGPDSVATRVMQRGVLNEVTGWDWTTRLSQSNMWIREAREGETLREDIINFLSVNLAPQVSQSFTMIDGIDHFMRGEWSKGFSKLFPAAVRGIFTAERYATEGDVTRSNRTVMAPSEFSLSELFGQGLGFSPSELSKEREMNRTTVKWQRAMESERNDLFADFREIYNNPDATAEDFETVFEQMRAYNAKVPLDRNGRPLSTYLIEGEDLERSLRSAEALDEKTYRGVQYGADEGLTFFPYEKREEVPE
jgi:hypothetical protein